METLLSKLSELRDRYFKRKGDDAQDIHLMDSWVAKAKRLLLLKSLKDHDGVKYVIEIFQSEVSRINQRLLDADSKSLPDYDRDRLIDKRDLAKKYLDLFLPIDDQLDQLEQDVDKELNQL